MQRLVRLMAVAAVPSTGLAAYFGWQLHLERARNSASSAVCERDESERAELGTKLGVRRAWRTGEHLPGDSEPVVHASVEEEAEIAADAQALYESAPSATLQFSPSERKSIVRRRFGELLVELGLTDAESDRLLELLATQRDRHDAWFAHKAPSLIGTDEFSPQGLPEEEQRRDRSELEQLLGSHRTQEFERLTRTLPARQELRMLRDELEESGVPMNEDQRRQLRALLQAAADRQPPRISQAGSPTATFRSYENWQQDFTGRVLGEASAVFTPKQLEVINQRQELQVALATKLEQAQIAPDGVGGAAGAPAIAQ